LPQAEKEMKDIYRNSWSWSFILGDIAISDEDDDYTLIVGYVNSPDEYRKLLYMRLWRNADDKFMAGSWVFEVEDKLSTTYYDQLSMQLVKKCLVAARRLEKLRVFA
jgi:hypothetical protein